MRLRHISIPLLVAEAGGDAWAINRSLQAGRPAQISDLAQAFRDAARSTVAAGTAFDAARRRFETAWNGGNGEHPINDSAEVRRVIESLGRQAAQLPWIAIDLEGITVALAEAQRSAGRYLAALEDDLQAIDCEIGEAFADGLRADDLCEEAVAETGAVLAQLKHIRDGYAAALRDALASLRTDGEPLTPPPGTSPDLVKRWWDSLSAEQRWLLEEQHPQELGNLDGIPADVRGRINVAVMDDDLRRVEDAARRYGVSSDRLRGCALNDMANDVLNNPARYGLSASDIVRYQNAVKTDEGLVHDSGVPNQPRPVLLWAYDPLAFGGKGRAAIAVGNPDKARNTAVIVPGADSSVKGGWLYDVDDDAVNLYDQSSKADPDHSTAVLAWMGYEAPGFDSAHWEQTVVDPSRLRPVATPWMARDGGALLAGDVHGLAAAHDGTIPSHTTIIGYSYGGTTVADAFARSGLRANDAVLIGCPGTDLAHNAADFHLNGGKLYVGAASTDAISWIGESGRVAPNAINHALGAPLGPLAGLGADPAHDGFGAVRFRAEVAGTRSVVPWFDDHLHYFDKGGEALHNMTEIATGHGDRLAGEGMLARERAIERLSTVSRVRTPFGTLTVPHAEIRVPVTIDPEWERSPASVTNDHDFK